MKKRVITVFLMAMLIVGMFPTSIFADNLVPLTTPTDLQWGIYYYCKWSWNDDEETVTKLEKAVPGMMSWKVNGPCQQQFKVEIFDAENPTEPLYSENWDISDPDDYGRYSSDDFITSSDEINSGRYFFTVKALGDGVTYQDSESVRSEVWEYRKPEQKLSAAIPSGWKSPTDQRNAVATWEMPSEPDKIWGHDIWFYFGKTNEEVPEYSGFSTTHMDFITDEEELYNECLQNKGLGYYYYKVRVLSRDITSIQNGPWSELSEAYNLIEDSALLKSQLQKILNEVDSPDEVRSQLWEMNKGILQEAMRADSDVLTLLSDLETSVGGSAEVVVNEKIPDIDSDKITIIGANLNPTTAQTPVSLQIDRAKEPHIIPELYNSALAVQFSMDLEGVEYADDLTIPVYITLPIPANINPDFLKILHYRFDGEVPEEIRAHVFNEDGQWYASFILDSFSDFVITETAREQETATGDLNHDGMINLADLNIIWNEANYNKPTGEAAQPEADINDDGIINLTDLNFVWNEERYNKAVNAQ